MTDGEGPPPRRDDITNPHEILLIEVAAAREQLRKLIEKMQVERLEWDRRLLELQHSPRLTTEQKSRLRPRSGFEKPAKAGKPGK
jgi:hypothetical protein